VFKRNFYEVLSVISLILCVLFYIAFIGKRNGDALLFFLLCIPIQLFFLVLSIRKYKNYSNLSYVKFEGYYLLIGLVVITLFLEVLDMKIIISELAKLASD